MSADIVAKSPWRRPWVVEVTDHLTDPALVTWQRSGLFLSYATPEAAVQRIREHWAGSIQPFSYRLLNRDTAEVIHLDAAGHPIDTAAEVMRKQEPADLDTIRARAAVLARRTHEQDMADRAGDRYEVQLDRLGGER